MESTQRITLQTEPHSLFFADRRVHAAIRRAAFIVVGVSLVFTVASAFAQTQNGSCAQRYKITDLGAVKEYIGPDVIPGLNASGHVTLWQESKKNQTYFPILWNNGVRTSFSVPTGYHNAFADAVNDRDIAVGWGNTSLNPQDSLSTTHAFMFQGVRAVDLGTLGGKDSRAYGINDHGVIVGASDVAQTQQRAFRYSNGKMTQLNPLPGGKSSIAFSINGSGTIAGTSEVLLRGATVPAKHATVWRNGRPHDLGVLTPGRNSAAYAINDQGDVTGAADKGPGQSVFLYTAGKMTNLKIEGRAYAINDKDQIVGIQEAVSGTAPPFAFLWDHGHDSDLNGCLISGKGVQLLYAYRINNSGQIASIARVDGVEHVLLLSPGN